MIDLAIVSLAISLAFVAHLVEIALWAVLLIVFGEFQEFGSAYYHSAVNYTTLGYGDLLLAPSWRLLAPLTTTEPQLPRRAKLNLRSYDQLGLQHLV